jgi:hypothetical protein
MNGYATVAQILCTGDGVRNFLACRCGGNVRNCLCRLTPLIWAQPKIGQVRSVRPLLTMFKQAQLTQIRVRFSKHVPLEGPFQCASNASNSELNNPQTNLQWIIPVCTLFIPAKLSRSAKQHPSNSAHHMRRFVRGFSIYAYQFFIPTDLQTQFPMCATCGAGVIGTSTYPSIPNVNVMRPERASSTSPITKANRPRPITWCNIYPHLRHVGFCSLIFQKASTLLKAWSSVLQSHARKPKVAHWTRHPRLQTPCNNPPEYGYV